MITFFAIKALCLFFVFFKKEMYKYFKGMFCMFKRLFSRKRECPECGFQGSPRDFKRVIKTTSMSSSSGSTGSSGSSGSSGTKAKKPEKKPTKATKVNASSGSNGSGGSGGSSGSSGK